MLSCLIKNIFGQDHTAINEQAKELKNCIAGYSTAEDLAKYWRDVLSNRTIYTKLIQYFTQPGTYRRTSEFELCEMVLSEVHSCQAPSANVIQNAWRV